MVDMLRRKFAALTAPTDSVGRDHLTRCRPGQVVRLLGVVAATSIPGGSEAPWTVTVDDGTALIAADYDHDPHLCLGDKLELGGLLRSRGGACRLHNPTTHVLARRGAGHQD